ncbi:MAG: FliM/FliN family flagellar motor switch protein [Rhizobiaceae bacterium]
MSGVPSSPAEMQAFIIERLKDRSDDDSDLGMLCDIVFKKLATSLSEHVPQLLSDTVEVEAVDWNAGELADVSENFSETDLLLVMGAEEGEPAGYATIDSAATSILFGVTLGADRSSEIMSITSPLSPMEAGILKISGHPFALAFKDAQLANSQFDIIDVKGQVDVENMSELTGEVVVFKFRLTFGQLSGEIALFAFRKLLTPNEDSVTAENDNLSKWNTDLRDGILQMNVGVKAIISLEPATLGDLGRLRVGDIIDFPADNPLQAVLSARNKTLFVGQFGRVGNRYSVRVERPNQHRSDLVEHIMSTM